MSFKKWLPSYLWYSGILMQAFMVILGIHALVAAFDRRPAHTLHNKLFQKLEEADFCQATFAHQEFEWRGPKSIQADIRSDKAEVQELVYHNRGSVGRTPEGYHVYRLQLEATLKDLTTNEVIRFLPRHERLVEVDARNRIINCHPDLNAVHLSAAQTHEFKSVACEKPGWSRRLMCDQGSERCYPMTLCERGS